MSLDRALRRLGAFARGVRPIRTLHAGPIKHSYLVERARERLVVRIDGPLAAALGLDRDAELRVLHAVSGAGIGPAPIAWRTAAPAVLVTRYVPGRSWRGADLRDPARLRQLAALLRRAHQLRPRVAALDLGDALGRYARIAGTPEAGELAREARALLARVRPHRDVLCHHDPVAANIVGLRRPRLIDWEYGARGDPLFDVALVIRHHALSERHAAMFLEAYAGTMTPRLARSVAHFAALYDRVLALWLMALRREAGGLTAAQRALFEAVERRLHAEAGAAFRSKGLNYLT